MDMAARRWVHTVLWIVSPAASKVGRCPLSPNRLPILAADSRTHIDQ